MLLSEITLPSSGISGGDIVTDVWRNLPGNSVHNTTFLTTDPTHTLMAVSRTWIRSVAHICLLTTRATYRPLM